MKLSCAFIVNNKQVDHKIFDIQERSLDSSIQDIQSLETEFNNIIIGDEEFLTSLPSLEKKLQRTAFFTYQQLGVPSDLAEHINSGLFEELIPKTLRNWTLANNLALLENYSATISHLKNLWVNERDQFFEELWSLLKTNLIAENITIIFRDLKKEKEELCYTAVTGTQSPEFLSKPEYETIMKSYESDFTSAFSITEYNRDRNQLVCTTKINQSSVLIMGDVLELGPLQQSLLKGLFNGLQAE